MGSLRNRPIATQALTLAASTLSPHAKIHTDPEDAVFQSLMVRYSDTDKLTPGAIIQPANEADIVTVAQYAIDNGIPFVPKAGGHSNWSTVGEKGWIVDLTLCDGVSFDKETALATMQAGVTTKQFNQVVSDAGFCGMSPSATTVGMIPFVLGGGRSWLTCKYGLAIDHLVSARIFTATKGLITVSETENKDLFWALKGAGWFFGIVTQITVKCFPVETPIISRVFMFAGSQVNDVAKAIESLANPGRDNQQGLATIKKPPGAPKPVIVVSTMNLCSQEAAVANTAPLQEIGPFKVLERTIVFKQITDAAEALNIQGGHKTVLSAGTGQFKAEKLVESFALFEKFLSKNPKCSKSSFGIDWTGFSGLSKRSIDSAAYSHRDRRVWAMPFNIGEDAGSGAIAEDYGNKFISLCQGEEERAFFPNHTRVHPLEERYRGEERRTRLKQLKRIWDPKGVFTTQLL